MDSRAYFTRLTAESTAIPTFQPRVPGWGWGTNMSMPCRIPNKAPNLFVLPSLLSITYPAAELRLAKQRLDADCWSNYTPAQSESKCEALWYHTSSFDLRCTLPLGLWLLSDFYLIGLTLQFIAQHNANNQPWCNARTRRVSRRCVSISCLTAVGIFNLPNE